MRGQTEVVVLCGRARRQASRRGGHYLFLVAFAFFVFFESPLFSASDFVRPGSRQIGSPESKSATEVIPGVFWLLPSSRPRVGGLGWKQESIYE